MFTGGLDGHVKVWGMNPPRLLTSFVLPAGQIPLCIAVDPLERWFHVGTDAGEVHHVRLFRRRKELGKRTEEGDDDMVAMDVGREERSELDEMMVAVGGEGEGSAGIRIGTEGDHKAGKGRISLGSVSVVTSRYSHSTLFANGVFSLQRTERPSPRSSFPNHKVTLFLAQPQVTFTSTRSPRINTYAQSHPT